MSERIEPAYSWTGRHLYQAWPSGRRVYVGSIVRDSFRRTWSAWQRGAYVASFSSQEGAREALEEFCRDQEKERQSIKT